MKLPIPNFVSKIWGQPCFAIGLAFNRNKIYESFNSNEMIIIKIKLFENQNGENKLF